MQHIALHAVFLLKISAPALAVEDVSEKDGKGIFNVVIENDISAGSDSDYTNVIRFAWLSSEENMPLWTRSIANSGGWQ